MSKREEFNDRLRKVLDKAEQKDKVLSPAVICEALDRRVIEDPSDLSAAGSCNRLVDMVGIFIKQRLTDDDAYLLNKLKECKTTEDMVDILNKQYLIWFKNHIILHINDILEDCRGRYKKYTDKWNKLEQKVKLYIEDIQLAESEEMILSILNKVSMNLILATGEMIEVMVTDYFGEILVDIAEKAGKSGRGIKNEEKGIPQEILARYPQVQKLVQTAITSVLELKEYAEKKQLEAEKDSMTGLYNKGTFNRRIEEVFEEYKQSSKKYTLCMFDIDFFKKLNDTYGHPAGDLVLKTVASEMMDIFPEGSCYRYGGEEFFIIVEGEVEEFLPLIEKFKKDLNDHDFIIRSSQILSKVQKKIQTTSLSQVDYYKQHSLKTINTDQVVLRVDISVGVVPVNGFEDASEWVTETDRCLYLAKGGTDGHPHNGNRGCIRTYDQYKMGLDTKTNLNLSVD